MMTREELVKAVGKMSWTDLVKNPSIISIEMMWGIYARNCFDGMQISQVQYDETKQAFYVGFAECFKFMNDIANGLSEDDACKVLSKINDECATFIETLLKKKRGI